MGDSAAPTTEIPSKSPVKLRMSILLSALAAAAAAWLVAPRLHRFAYWSERRSPTEIAALARDGWQIDRLPVAPAVELHGLVRPPRDPQARWILFVPGNSQSVLAGFQAELDRLRGADDTGLAFWAPRGFDASQGVPTPAALAADLLLQWQRLLALGATPARLEVWAYSLGTPLALQLAAELGRRGTAPARLVLIASSPTIPVMPYGTFGRFLPDDVYDATAALPQVTCPTVLIHGTIDAALPIEGARTIARALGARAMTHELPGIGHLDVWPHVRKLAW